MNTTSETAGERQFDRIKHTRHFAKCGTCGSFGHHAGPKCPAYQVNREQEQLTKEIQTLGLSAEVQMKVDEVKRAWRIRNVQQKLTLVPKPVVVDQVDILRAAWGCR